MSWAKELALEISGQVLTDDVACNALATDFGRLVVRKPTAVVRPASTEDVARVVKFAARQGLSVATHGAGHSQTGQSLSEDIVLDMTSLAELRRVDEEGGTAVCQGGMKWRSLVETLLPLGLSPPVLTNNLDVTIGGTLSTGGLGVASWRHGTQADNCLELEVVTGTGDIVPCSPDRNSDLFNAVRAGVGQFGIITEATVKVRRHKPGFRSLYLLYDDLSALLDDMKILMNEERFDYMESWCVPCAQGFKSVGTQRQAFAQWFFPLHLTLEAEWMSPAEPSAADLVKLQALRYYKHVYTEQGAIGDFFKRLDSLFELWKRAGVWENAHPWMESVLPWPSTLFYITQALQNMPPQAVAGGHVLLWPARGNASSVPLFMRPQSEFLMGFGILPAVPRHLVDEALPRLNLASQASVMMGGKRYLSGWIAFDAAQWKAHYGPNWPTVLAMKKKFDPQGILNPGFVKYE